MATTAEHIVTRGDAELLARLVAVAEMQGIPSAAVWVQVHMGELISTPVDGTDVIADFYATAHVARQVAIDALPDLPGADPAAVTDAHLVTAVTALITPETPPSP